MHIEYAADAFVRMQKPKHSEPFSQLQTVAVYVTEQEFLNLADKIDGVTSEISKTVRETQASGNRFAKVTSKQKNALAFALLDKYKTALACYAAAYKVTEEEFINNASK
jgi:hypothetical protein